MPQESLEAARDVRSVVLVVDDDEGLRESCRLILEEEFDKRPTVLRAGKLPKEFGLANSIDCRNENELLVGEMTNWRVQKVSLKR